MSKLDITKPVQLRGHEHEDESSRWTVTDVFRLSEPLEGGAVLVGAATRDDGIRSIFWWMEDGSNSLGHKSFNLINVPEETVLWANVYNGSSGQKILVTVESRERADRVGSEDRIGLFKFTFTEGQDPKAEFVPLEEAE